MIPRILLIAALGICSLTAADPSTEDLLRQGLFEEEANRDFDKAAESYRAVIAAHDKQRAFAATATYRLGEIARKKNDKEAAANAFKLVAERYPEQTELARLSRENLVTLGVNLPSTEETGAPPSITTNDPEETEIARLKDIAKNSPDLIDGSDPSGWRPIHTAAKNGWTKVIAYLLENKADPNSRTTKEQLTPLQIATFQGHLSSVKALIAGKAEINATFDIGLSPDVGLLPARQNSARDLKGEWSALHLAILYDRREIARTLIQAGADIKSGGPIKAGADIKNRGFYPPQPNCGFSPLQLAIMLLRNELALALIEAGAPLGTGGYTETNSPLSLAVTDNRELVAPLLKAGADPKEAGTKDGFTALHFAALYKAIDTAKLLLDAGADANAVNAAGQTPLHIVYHPEMVELLVSRGADPNAKDKRGFKPLDAVAEREELNAAVFEALLKHGAVVEDAKELLKHTSLAMLPVVREKVAYPKEYREDAILISNAKDQGFQSGPGSIRRGSIDVAEIRPTIGSPPPTLLEVLWAQLGESRNVNLISLNIVRRDANGKFMKHFEWSSDGGASSIKNPPALEWGDIVEFETSYNANAPFIGTLFPDEITARSVTYRLAGATFHRRIESVSEIWLKPILSENDLSNRQGVRQPRPRVVPSPGGQPGNPVPQPNYSESNLMPKCLDESRTSVTRKGVDKPILVDLTQKDARPFRLVDGDVIDFVLKESVRKEMEENKLSLSLGWSLASANYVDATGLLTSLIGAGKFNYQVSFPNEPDWSEIRIIREGMGQKLETFNLLDWTSKLPPREKWEAATFETVPTLKPGDVVVVPPLPEDSDKDRRAGNLKVLELIPGIWEFIGPRPSPGVIPAPGGPGRPR